MKTSTSKVIYAFNKHTASSAWMIVNDGVMGGLSKATLTINNEGIGVFSGNVSTENNGGFTSMKTRFSSIDVRSFQKIVLRIKGDGKRYQLRLKSEPEEAHSYISYFQTSGEWETIELALPAFYPSFRGRRLAMPSYPKEKMAELAFLIANQKEELFHLMIDCIILR